jgi:hypothetical protein
VAGARLCRGERYEVLELDKVRRRVVFSLPPSASPDLPPFGRVSIEKSFSFKKDVLVVGYTIANRGAGRQSFQFAPEIDLSFPGEGEQFMRCLVSRQGAKDAPAAEPVLCGVDGLKIQDLKNEVQITVASACPFDGRIAAVRISGAEAESLYQASCLMPVFPLSLESGETWTNEFSLKFSH